MSKDLKDLWTLTGRHMKLYFKDKQSFLTSLITPVILIVLFVTFLKNVYTDSLLSIVPKEISLDSDLVENFVGTWLLSSILGVSCVTIAFCANTIMVSDKINKSIDDILIAPVRRVIVSLSYFTANFLSTLLVCVICLIVGLVYVSRSGWYITGSDLAMVILVMLLCIAFGTLLASILESFISSQGGASALATLVSSMYGFVCGAYMPISQFSKGIQNFVGVIPGTHGTVLFRYYLMNGIIDKMGDRLPDKMIGYIREGFDNQLTVFDRLMTNGQMFTVLGGACAALLIIYVLLVVIRRNKR